MKISVFCPGNTVRGYQPLTVAKVQLLSLLDETMPGITTILPLKSRDPDNCVLLRFIKRFKSFDVIRKMGKTRFLDSYQVLVKRPRIVLPVLRDWLSMSWSLAVLPPVEKIPYPQ